MKPATESESAKTKPVADAELILQATERTKHDFSVEVKVRRTMSKLKLRAVAMRGDREALGEAVLSTLGRGLDARIQTLDRLQELALMTTKFRSQQRGIYTTTTTTKKD